jgi:GxxExxY protein
MGFSMLNRVKPACSPEVEAIITRTIGCAIRVHSGLGPGYTEAVYHDAMAVELTASSLTFVRNFPVKVSYRGEILRDQYLDLVVAGAIVVELKAVERLARIHEMQLLSYMKTARLKAGLLMNFHAEYLRSQLRRYVL